MLQLLSVDFVDDQNISDLMTKKRAYKSSISSEIGLETLVRMTWKRQTCEQTECSGHSSSLCCPKNVRLLVLIQPRIDNYGFCSLEPGDYSNNKTVNPVVHVTKEVIHIKAFELTSSEMY